MIKTLLLISVSFLLVISSACNGEFTSIKTKTENITDESIIYVSDREGNTNFYTMNPDGSNIQKINLENFPSTALISGIQWSPSLQKYLVTAMIGTDSDIYTMDWDGDNLDNLANTPGIMEDNPVPSPNGEWIAFIASEIQPEIVLMQPNGKNKINLSKFAGQNSSPTWAPDNSRIYFNSNREGTPNIFSVELDASDVTNISHGRGLDAKYSVSPDGEHLVFDSDRDGAMDLFVIPTSGGEPTNITQHQAIDVEPVWSPDGQWIAFRSNRDGGWDLFITSPDGETVKNLTMSPDIDEVNFSWAPDSQHLVFNSNLNNQIDIFVIDLAGNAPINISNNPANDYGPVWVTNK